MTAAPMRLTAAEREVIHSIVEREGHPEVEEASPATFSNLVISGHIFKANNRWWLTDRGRAAHDQTVNE